jgi:hypothetical protein
LALPRRVTVQKDARVIQGYRVDYVDGFPVADDQLDRVSAIF